jgi:general secretion pathway protein F
MSNFAYTALTPAGKTESGLIEADNRDAAVSSLQQKNLLPMAVELKTASRIKTEATDGKGSYRFASWLHKSPKLTNKQLVLVTQQLATLIHSALPVDEAIQVLIDQTTDRKLSGVLSAIRHHINDGQPLGTAMSKASSSFTPAYTATIAAGETNGQLGLVLQRLADYSKRMQHTKSKIQIAMIYPSIIVLVCISVVVLLMLYVVPQVSEVITNMNQTLPALTVAMIAMSEFLQQWGLSLLLAMLLAMLLFSFMLRIDTVRMRVHQSVLKIPGIGRLMQSYWAARFCKSLALIYNSGQPVEQALQTASQVVSNDFMRRHINQASQQIEDGEGFLVAFKGRPVLPLMSLHLIASGQANGQLANMLERASDDLEQTLENTISVSLALLEPLMMLLMGGIVLLIVMAVMVPILDMNQLMM